MSDLEYLKQFHSMKDVADIITDIEKIDVFLQHGMWPELQKHIDDVCWKYPVERAAHNAKHLIPPSSLEESAQNCRQFLINIGKAKITTEGLRHLNEDSRKKQDQQDN